MLQLFIVLVMFPALIPLLKNSIPPVVAVDEPLIVQYLTVLVEASSVKRIVEVPSVAEVLVLVMIRSLITPVAFTLPSMVTLSAPLRSISGASMLPVMVRPVTVG